MGLEIKSRSATVSGGGGGVMTEELRRDPGEQLPDLVQHSSESSSSRRVRSQSLGVLSDHDDEICMQIGRALRRFSNEFEASRLTTRNEQRRSSISNFFNWVS